MYLFLFLGASTAALVPTPLLDMRYFIVPWVMLALESRGLVANSNEMNRYRSQWKDLRLNIAYFCLVNAGVFYVFLCKPWENHFFGGEISRFFW